jgi:glycolate oxidase
MAAIAQHSGARQRAELSQGDFRCQIVVLVIFLYQFSDEEDRDMEMPTPDAAILSRKSKIVELLRAALPKAAVIHDEAEVRAYECDALTAYRCPPLAVVLPATTEEVATALRICHAEGVPVVPRGSGTSLAGGALPTADSVILGVARMNKVLETDYDNRFIRVQTGRTNLSVTGAVEQEDFFYAPDPSSQLACAIAGNIAMNSGGAHCLKYGVTTNNLLGVTMVTMAGEVLEIGGAHLDAGGYDLLGVICGSEGQLGVVTEATLRILRKPEGARPVLIGFDSNEVAGACVSDIIKAGVLPVAIEFMDRPCIEATEAFAKAGYPMCEALLIVEVEGSPAEIDAQLGLIARSRAATIRWNCARRNRRTRPSASGWAANRPLARWGRSTITCVLTARSRCRAALCAQAHRRDVQGIRPGRGQCVPCGRRQHAPADPVRCQQARRSGAVRGLRRGYPEALRRGGRMPDRRAWRGDREARPDETQFAPADLEAQMRVKDVFDPAWLLNPAKVFPLSVSRERRERQVAA